MTEQVRIHTKDAPAAVGPYSQGVKTGNMIFVSGQMPVVPSTGEAVEGDAGEKAKQCMKNVLAILKEAGLTADNIVKTTIFLTDMNDFGAVNEVYASFFGDNYPARSCVEVSRLPKGVDVEIEAIAAY
ncbi:MAG: RidA family protein [Bacillota bacterium]